jgi:hypothetical protein
MTTPHNRYMEAAKKRANKVRELAKQTPKLTQDEIAKKVKLTRQRVGQILGGMKA